MPLFPRIREIFYGKAQGPHSKYISGETQTASEYYEGMEKHYREYRRDALVRGCINVRAYFSTCKGFTTSLELTQSTGDKEKDAAALEKYVAVKERIDQLNKAVNLDHVLFVAIVKSQIYGRAGFEIQPKFAEDWPEKLIPLFSDSTKLKPKIAEDFSLTGYDYKGLPTFYQPCEILYFPNLCLEADLIGLSDIEPVTDVLATRRALVGEDLRETAKTLWAPLSIHQIDTSGLSKEDAEKAIDDHVAQIKPGKSIATNQKITVQVVDNKPDIAGLVQALEYCDYEIIGNFRVPRFLLGREKQVNRATAEKEFEAFIDGPIADIQRYYKREVERQWYDPIIKKELSLAEDAPLPVRVKHVWNPITSEDFLALAGAVAQLWGGGLGPIGGNRKKVWTLMNWDLSEIEGEGDNGLPLAASAPASGIENTPSEWSEEKLEQRREVAEAIKDHKTILELFAGEGNISEIYAGLGKRHILIDDDAKALEKAKAKVKDALIFPAKNEAWMKQHLSELEDISLVDFDPYGSPTDAVKQFFSLYKVREPIAVAITDGTASNLMSWFPYHLWEKYEAKETNYRERIPVLLDQLLEQLGEKYGFKAERINGLWGGSGRQQRVYYTGYLLKPS